MQPFSHNLGGNSKNALNKNRSIYSAAVDGIKSYMQNCMKPRGSEWGGGWYDTNPSGIGECR